MPGAKAGSLDVLWRLFECEDPREESGSLLSAFVTDIVHPLHYNEKIRPDSFPVKFFTKNIEVLWLLNFYIWHYSSFP